MNDNKICPFRMIAGAIRACNTYCVKDHCAWWREQYYDDEQDRCVGCCAVLVMAKALEEYK